LTYKPRPIETSHIELSHEIVELTERLSEHAHDVWAKQRLADGWVHGRERNDATKQHPSLVPYAELSESEKQYDRNASLETIKAMLALGYRIEPP
jgi:RyR domain